MITAGIPPQPYGKEPRKVNRPVAATTQLYQGQMISEIAGAAVPGTTASGSDCIGVCESDVLGGASDGTKRCVVLNDCVFLMTAGSAAPTDATPFGSLLFMESDILVGTGGLGATQKVAGRFVGMADDGRVRMYVGPYGSGEFSGDVDDQITGTALTDVAATTVQRGGRVTKYLLAGTMSQGETITLGTTGAVVGDVIRIIRTSTSAQTCAVVNGGAGAGTLCTLVASKVGFAFAIFDGTNWLYDGSSAT